LHLMLMGLTGSLKEGETVSVSLTFQQAGELIVDMPVLRD